MRVQASTEQAIRVLNENITELAIKSDIERKLLLNTGRPKAAESIGALMQLVWKLFRCCKELQAENVIMRRESMQRKELRREAAKMQFNPVAKEKLN